MSLPDPATLWHQTAPAMAPFPHLSGRAESDLAVVGGGLAGLSTALHAAQAGLNVVLLEANRVAWGASGRNAGFVVPNFAKADPDDIRETLGAAAGGRLVKMAAGSADLVFGLIRSNGIDCDAAQAGWIQPSHSNAAFTRARQRVEQWQQEGRPVELLNARAIEELTGVSGWRGGWIDHSGGTLNPVAYARGLARAAALAGATLYEDSPVNTLRPVGKHWELATPGGLLTARKVVLATNAHAGNLWPGLDRSFFPLRVFQIATAPIPAADRLRLLPDGMALSDSRRSLFTFRLDPQGRLITGGMHILGPGADRRVPQTIMHRLARAVGLEGRLTMSHAWSGLAAVSPDFLPRVIEPAPGLIAGLACNGRGIAMTTAMGRELADWAAGRPAEHLALPKAPLRTIPFHMFTRLAPNLLLPISIMQDRLESPTALPR